MGLRTCPTGLIRQPRLAGLATNECHSANVDTPRNLAKSVTVEFVGASIVRCLFAPNESVPRPLVKTFRGGGQNSLKPLLDRARSASTVVCVFGKKSGPAPPGFESNRRARAPTERFFFPV